MDKKQELRNLVEELKKLDYHYYTLDEPLVSDGEYDKLYNKLLDLEKELDLVYDDSPSKRVGGQVLDGFERHYHITRLLSQDKAQSYDDLKDWIARCKKIMKAYEDTSGEKLADLEFIMEYKFDGLTINLTYENGMLKTASTRGNGIYGENVTAQVETIRSVPFVIEEKSLLEIQGEALMPISELKRYNKENELQLKNARNAAAGAIRNLDTSETAKRRLTAFFYAVPTNSLDFKDEEETLEFLKNQRFRVDSYHEKVSSIDEIIDQLEKIEIERKKLDILTDGVVIKINDKKTQDVLGYTNKFPRWSIAYKFEAEEFTTKLLEVQWNVGRTGKVTPSAIVDPVDFSGVTVTRATLNNYDDIERKKLRLGSTVFIRRSNDVIPEILGVVDENEEGTQKIEKPSRCPYCHSELIQGNVHIICLNSISCTPQLLARMEHYASRNAMDIEGLSEKTISQLIDEYGIKEIYDIYDLRYDDLIELDRFGPKKTQNLLDAIEASKEADLSHFIYAIGIPNVGERTARDLADKFKTFDRLKNAGNDELIEVEDIGEITAANIVDFFHDEEITRSIDILLDKGIKLISPKDQDENNKNLDGLNIVVTGTIDGYNRNDIKDILEKSGANVRSSVSKNTDLVLAGESPGSKKEKAISLSVKILEDSELYKFLSDLKGE
uniref:NAD-dependent DNA ligase LigA n=1 Tax=Anaerococcus mediterraneensis TaxID=1870984 RepID=UPI000931AE4C|nr:NAD-dependent DNA ligase LigA [Anaerococcus mediterraneensis]